MNKRELIRKYEELLKEHSHFHEPVPYTSMVELFLKELKLLDEPQKVKVPQFVADVIEEARKSCKDVAELLEFDFTNEEVGNWFLRENPIDLIARAWIDGYEVEEEKRYLVKMNGIKDPNSYLKYNRNTGHWYFGSLHIYVNDVDTKIYHTRKELDEANFGWVFDCPGIEILEVEK